jgi:hypothetical protein
MEEDIYVAVEIKCYCVGNPKAVSRTRNSFLAVKKLFYGARSSFSEWKSCFSEGEAVSRARREKLFLDPEAASLSPLHSAPARQSTSMASTSASQQEDLVILPLGGGQEVGRSCIILKYQRVTIMLDCGSHPGREGEDSLPFFDLERSEDIDIVLITHFHIDHCAALPYFTEKTNFKGKIFMTHATKAVMKLLLSDNIRLHSKSPSLYNEQVSLLY